MVCLESLTSLSFQSLVSREEGDGGREGGRERKGGEREREGRWG